jgi:hypothetical protein
MQERLKIFLALILRRLLVKRTGNTSHAIHGIKSKACERCGSKALTGRSIRKHHTNTAYSDN